VIGAWGAAAILVATLAWGCGTQQTPTPAPSASAPPSTPVAAKVTPAPAYADALRVGYRYDWFPSERQASTAEAGFGTDFGFLVHATLYRLDDRFGVLPDLADGPCLPQGDGTVIRCRIIETTFHDGTPLTADDVAYAFELRLRDTFPFAGAAGSLEQVRIVDEHTVDFTLASVDPTFLTTILSAVAILPRPAVEASFAAFATATKGLDAADLMKLADAIDEEIGRDPPVCSPRVDDVAAIVAQIGVTLYREDFARNETAAFDPCWYLQAASAPIRQAAVAMGLAGPDAVAAAWQLLGIDWRPIGAGPYRLASEDADGVHLEAWPGYHGGVAATRHVDLVPANPDGSGLEDGTVDLLWAPELDAGYEATAAARGVRIVTTPQVAFIGLFFNVRPGQLFAQRELRLALQLCVDLERNVDAATGGAGIPAYGPVTPGSWGYYSDLPRPARDVTAARKLIEDAGWRLGTDGVFLKDGLRLAADIPVRSEAAPRIKMADLIALQARDCGMDLRTLPLEFDAILAMLAQYPHPIPNTDRPFDLYVGGWWGGVDPALAMDLVGSSQLTDVEHPDRANVMGFSDPAVDRLLEAALATYDQAERARLYREAQREVAGEVPVLFLWWGGDTGAVRSEVATADGPLDLEVPNWAWQPERLVVAAPGS
jgi:ABC-type transport system substrate-binding protein